VYERSQLPQNRKATRQSTNWESFHGLLIRLFLGLGFILVCRPIGHIWGFAARKEQAKMCYQQQVEEEKSLSLVD
jgi:hypothetical protein